MEQNMAVGFPITKGYLDNRAGQLILDLQRAFAGIDRYWEYMAAQSDQDLIDEFGYTTEEVETLRNAMGALAKLSRVSRGQDTAAAPDNFFFHANKLTALE